MLGGKLIHDQNLLKWYTFILSFTSYHIHPSYENYTRGQLLNKTYPILKKQKGP